MNARVPLTVAAALFAFAARCPAPPPLVTGDVPVADPGTFELYAGFRYQDTGRIERQVPHVELVYGLTERWEVSTETNYLSRTGRRGFDDLTLATKALLVAKTPASPMLGASYELKLANSDAARGLGSGGREHELRLRAQQTFGALTPVLNVGRVLVADVTIGGAGAPRQDAWRASFAQEWQLVPATKLLGEIHWRTADEPGETHRLGWNAGLKRRLPAGLSAHAAVGGSLRPGDRGGPALRVYTGLKWEFAAPWRP
ncbi:MAG: hypothetical protein HZA93_25920 [Verrucomicrobia bacterium]|nr:hypothetical protein [Verrucomicrobiota bacterium]